MLFRSSLDFSRIFLFHVAFRVAYLTSRNPSLGRSSSGDMSMFCSLTEVLNLLPRMPSPLDLADFMYHDLYEKPDAFGIHKIEKDKVILKPSQKINTYRRLSGRIHTPPSKWNLVLPPTKETLKSAFLVCKIFSCIPSESIPASLSVTFNPTL